MALFDDFFHCLPIALQAHIQTNEVDRSVFVNGVFLMSAATTVAPSVQQTRNNPLPDAATGANHEHRFSIYFSQAVLTNPSAN